MTYEQLFKTAIKGNSITITGVNSKPAGALVIPDTILGLPVTAIGDNVFRGCTGLRSITIPKSVTSIGLYALSNCRGLTSITVDGGNSSFTSDNGVLFNKAKNYLIAFPRGKTGGYTIPNSVTSIGSYAFSGCSGLTSVTIPSSVTHIGNYAFASCTGLTNVIIPDGIAYISNYAFYNCTGLTSVTMPDDVPYVGRHAFEGCTRLNKTK